MRDKDVRAVLDGYLRETYTSDPSTLFVHELGVCCGAARVDMAVVNSHLAGFEIKSEADTLDRLPRQIELYSKVFDQLTVVANGRHVDRLLAELPEWCGVIEVDEAGQGTEIRVLRGPKPNAVLDPFAVAQLVWRDEALDILHTRGIDAGIRSKPRRVLWTALADSLPLDELRAEVRSRLKERDAWRPDRPRTQGGATSRL